MSTTRNLLVLFVTVVGMTFASPQQTSQTPAKTKQQGTTTQTGRSGRQKMTCQEMMTKWNQTMADLKAAKQRLDAKIAAMDSAKGDDRIAAMESVIRELADQHESAITRLNNIHQSAMAHMRQHMIQAGNTTMKDCPMMHSMGSTGAVGQ